jgi:Zn-finger nucleic acid-binding protein
MNTSRFHWRLMAALGLTAMIATLTSCQSVTTEENVHAVMCDGCKTVWLSPGVNVGSSGETQPTIYRSNQKKVCPHCESAAATFFKTGEIIHHCAHCKGTLTHCQH